MELSKENKAFFIKKILKNLLVLNNIHFNNLGREELRFGWTVEKE